MSLTQAALEALARCDTSTRHLMALEMSNAVFPGGYIRIVNYDFDISVGGQQYTGMAMDTMVPEIGNEPDNDVRLHIDGVAGTYQFYLNQANDQGTPVGVKLTSFLFNTMTESVIEILGEFDYELKATQFDSLAAMPQIGNTAPTNQQFPNVKYSATSHQALYR